MNFNFLIQREIGNSSWFGFAVIVQENAPFSRDQLVSVLSKREIECRPIVGGNILKNEISANLVSNTKTAVKIKNTYVKERSILRKYVKTSPS